MSDARFLMLTMCMVLSALALVACGHSGGDNTAVLSDTSLTASSSMESSDPCSLLEPGEIEAVLGAPLATPPFLSQDGRPELDGSLCDYEDARLQEITVDVDWDHGAMAFSMLGSLQGMVDSHAKGLVHLAEGADLAGEWDEARVVGCCSFAALRGDQLVTIDVGGSKATIAAAAGLANSALKRLDKPLAIGGWRNVKPATAYELEHRPKLRDSCALVTRAEAEALIGALAGDPKSVEERCLYERASSSGPGQVYVLKVRWRGGFSEYRQQNEMFGTFTQSMSRSMKLSGDIKEAFESTGVGGDLPANPAWDSAHYNIAGLTAVKKDVLISIEPQGGSADDALKLMEKAMSRL
jgi:hypothetical protein